MQCGFDHFCFHYFFFNSTGNRLQRSRARLTRIFLEISLIFAGIYFGRFSFSFLSLLSKINGFACGQCISLGVWSFIALETKIKKSSTPSHTSYVFVVFTHEGRDSGKKHNSQQVKKFIFLNHLKSSCIVWLTINVFLTNC